MLLRNIFLLLFIFITQLLSGQSQFIHVDQFGYLPDASKVAVLSNPQTGFNANLSYNAATTLQVKNATTDVIVFSGSPTEWNSGATHEPSGDKGWWFDFSSLSANGSYYIYDPSSGERSAVFDINENVYSNLLKDAGRMFFYNRCNYEKAAPYAESAWTDGMNFRNSGQDANCRYYLDPNNASTERDLTGGWFDAGDYNKYVTFAEDAVHDLLWAYRENPQAFSDAWNIPESGNGIPDIIDEIKWEIDWLKKMDNEDGSVIIKMGSISYEHNEEHPPSANLDVRYYGETCTSASIAFAGMLAHAAVVYQDFPALIGEVNTLAADAERAFDYFVNALNNNSLEVDCDDGTIKSGIADNEEKEQKFSALTAAIHLFELTEKNKFHDYIKDHIMDAEPITNYWWGPYIMPLNTALLHYTTLPNYDEDTRNLIIERMSNPVQNGTEFFGYNPDDLYRAFMPNWAYHWGSSKTKASFGVQNLLAAKYNLDASNNTELIKKAAAHLHYFHGVNPLGMVYLTNMNDRGAERSANEMYHTWFSHESEWDNAQSSLYGPAPGYVVGGPNSSFSVGSISPPSNQPIMKSYLDFNNGDPQASWEITEPAIYYQAAYIRLLASQVENPTVLAVTYEEPLRAFIQNNQVALNWKISEEINADYYEIQHQTESSKWQVIGKVATANLKQYQFVHTNPRNGAHFYRLRQVDKDGRFTFSNVATIMFKDKYAEVTIVNPIQSNQLIISNLPDKSTVRISDAQGQLLTVLKSSGGTLEYGMEYLSIGMYIVEILNTEYEVVKAEKVIKN